ncbi:hypothetical protein JXA02_10390, partial [candidate division KSB1 bacterium]|nr:hypothetical protein [candidate division KSB1 bacterium]
GPDSIRSELVQRPLDLNDSTEVELGPIAPVVSVSTVSQRLAIERFEITGPEGAKDRILSTEQTFFLRAIVQSSQNLRDRTVTLDYPRTGYRLIAPNSQIVPTVAEKDTIEWEIQAPADADEQARDFTLVVQGYDEDDVPRSERRSLRMERIQRKATLSLRPLEVEPKAVIDQNGEAHFTLNQLATIRTRVDNNGEASYSGAGRVVLDVDTGESGFEIIDGNAEQQFTDDSWISWQVRPTALRPERREITVRIIAETLADTLKDENTNKTVAVSTPLLPLFVYVNEGGSIAIDEFNFLSTTYAPIDSVSSDQDFIVEAQITTAGVKDVHATLRAEKADSKFRIIGDAVKIITSNVVDEAVWTVRAPANTSDSDNLILEVTAIDEQSNEPLPTGSGHTRSIYVPVAQRTTFDFEPDISFPRELAGDYRLSTGQLFNVAAEIEHVGAKYDPNGRFRLKLYPPAGFDFDGDAIEKVCTVAQWEDGEIPEWRLKAPNSKADTLSEFEIWIEETPADIFSKQPARVVENRIKFPVRTVDRAQVYFDAYLHDDVLLDSSSVRHGSDFTITAWLDNVGEAGLLGGFKAELIAPDSTWIVDDPKEQRVDSDVVLSLYKIDWQVRAPQKKDVANPDTVYTFDLRLLDLPDDQYARQDAALLSGSAASVRVTLETGAVKVWPDTVRTNTIVVRDTTNLAIMGLKLQNKNASGTTKSYLQSLSLSIRDKIDSLISPKPMISRVAAVRAVGGEMQILAESSILDETGKVFLSFAAPSRAATAATYSDSLMIIGSTTDSIMIVVDIPANAELKDFKITVDSLTAVDEDGYPLDIADADGKVLSTLRYASIMAVLTDADLTKSFFNYPNPFGRVDDPSTSFVYYLENDSDIKIHIYTLTGDLVKTWNYTQAEHPDLTTAGLHQGDLTWDGLNGMGQRVRNGVYLAYISTSDGKQAMTKIAVVR